MSNVDQTVLDNIIQVKLEVTEASKILRRRNPILAEQWDRYPDSRRVVAYEFAAMFLLGRGYGNTSLAPDAQFVWCASVNDLEWRHLFPEFFTSNKG